jgi:hypothetical protein
MFNWRRFDGLPVHQTGARTMYSPADLGPLDRAAETEGAKS